MKWTGKLSCLQEMLLLLMQSPSKELLLNDNVIFGSDFHMLVIKFSPNL